MVIPAKAGIQWVGFMERHAAVYILANKGNGTLYTGAISNLTQRIWQHRHGEVSGFASKYNVDRLVWYELHDTMEAAITRAKNIKEWKRSWQRELIEASNPGWYDLYEEVCR